ncbi:hypothetical protein C0J26_04875 [Pseudomonas baetica]|nr:hypothetical protein C0J26_04875 [Pseudomonas baetica]
MISVSPVGASLLAKAELQPTSMLSVKSPSRAGSLPQWGMCGVSKRPCGIGPVRSDVQRRRRRGCR